MATDTYQKPATARQLAYIKRLRTELGVNAPPETGALSSASASLIIGELIAQNHKNGVDNGGPKPLKINEPRLGMAMKECFRLHTKLGRDIWQKKRKYFIQDVLETYALFTEAAERMEKRIQLSG